jgi:hypothetical protein
MARPEADLRVTRGYISAKIWAQAIEAAGTTDGVAVAQALHAGTFRVFGIEARFDAYRNMEARSESPLFGSGKTAGRCPWSRVRRSDQSQAPAGWAWERDQLKRTYAPAVQ